MHKARKRFGQNFLTDLQVIKRIIACINLQADDDVVEIGPGLGALTQEILPITGKLDVIELDRDLIPKLQAYHGDLGILNIHQGDALNFDFKTLDNNGNKLRIIGNLPYNISTQLLFHLLTFIDNIQDMHFMLQKEVVDRMAASSNTSAYGRLSVMLQYYCRVEKVFHVPATAFSPEPKVESAIVRLIPHQQLPVVAENIELFAEIVREAFNHRRKTLRNCLKPYINADGLSKLDIDPRWRPEQLSVADFVRISNAC